MAEATTASFVMHGACDAIAGGLGHIEQQVQSIEQAVVDNPALAFDLARTLVESVCRTVLTERAITFNQKDDLPKLFKATTRSPAGASTESRVYTSLHRTLSGLSTAIQGICELRNMCGFASHGSDKERPAMEATQAFLAAQTADAIVGFLHRVHRQDRASRPEPHPSYEANHAFNEMIDEAHSMIRVFDVEFRPSEVLFEMEPETYRIHLAEFDVETGNQTEVDEP